MKKNENKDFSQFLEPDEELSREFLNRLSPDMKKTIEEDRLTHKLLKNTFQREPATTIDERTFKKNLLAALDGKNDKNLNVLRFEGFRDTALHLRENLLYNESITFTKMAVLAASAIFLSIPLFHVYQENQIGEALAVKEDVFLDEVRSNRVSEFTVRREIVAPDSSNQNGIPVPQGIVDEEKISVASKSPLSQKSVSTAERNVKEYDSMNEESILQALKGSIDDSKRLYLLEKLAKIYSENGQTEKLKKTKQSIESIKRSDQSRNLR